MEELGLALIETWWARSPPNVPKRARTRTDANLRVDALVSRTLRSAGEDPTCSASCSPSVWGPIPIFRAALGDKLSVLPAPCRGAQRQSRYEGQAAAHLADAALVLLLDGCVAACSNKDKAHAGAPQARRRADSRALLRCIRNEVRHDHALGQRRTAHASVLEALFHAHVRMSSVRGAGEALRALIETRVAALFRWPTERTWNDLFSPQQIAGIVERNVIELKVAGASLSSRRMSARQSFRPP